MVAPKASLALISAPPSSKNADIDQAGAIEGHHRRRDAFDIGQIGIDSLHQALAYDGGISSPDGGHQDGVPSTVPGLDIGAFLDCGGKRFPGFPPRAAEWATVQPFSSTALVLPLKVSTVEKNLRIATFSRGHEDCVARCIGRVKIQAFAANDIKYPVVSTHRRGHDQRVSGRIHRASVTGLGQHLIKYSLISSRAGSHQGGIASFRARLGIGALKNNEIYGGCILFFYRQP